MKEVYRFLNRRIEAFPNCKSWGMSLESYGDDSEQKRSKLIVQAFGWFLLLRLPGWVCPPLKRWRDLRKDVGKPGYEWLKPRPDGRYGYNEIIVRRFQFLLFELRSLHLAWGVDDDDCWKTTRRTSKVFFFPWLESTFLRHSLYDLDGGLYYNVRQDLPFLDERRASEGIREAQPRAYFVFSDYDSQEIKATCRFEEREWAKGTGWFKWLRYLTRNDIRHSMDIEFSSEVGRQKGSWKGGTIGHSIECKRGEAPDLVFQRYCRNQKLGFVGACAPWKREYPKTPAADTVWSDAKGAGAG